MESTSFELKLKEIGDKLLEKLLIKIDEMHNWGPNEISVFMTILKEAAFFCHQVDSHDTRLERANEPWSHNNP